MWQNFLFKSRPRKESLKRKIVINIFVYRDRFPYYKSNDDRWKNSVRHNLSINPHFRKGNKAKAGAGHLWKISSRESEANFLAWEHVRLFKVDVVLHVILMLIDFDSEETAPGTVLQNGSSKSVEASRGESKGNHRKCRFSVIRRGIERSNSFNYKFTCWNFIAVDNDA